MRSQKRLIITGGAGFIGSHFVELCVQKGMSVMVIDCLSYAGHRVNLEGIEGPGSFEFVEARIEDRERMRSLVTEFRPDSVVNFAAESHVDRSISAPAPFLETNVMGTFSMLEASREYWGDLSDTEKSNFRFLQVSTDEVYGELGSTGKFSERTPYSPNSPYSASKASADHLARAWMHTYGLPTLVTNCSNNYGPKQLPEKFIPVVLRCLLDNRDIPIYGKGQNVRDWIFVKDHCRGIMLALEKAEPGSTYCFGGNAEAKNIDLVTMICEQMQELRPKSDGSYKDQITFVKDRAGHDFRYAIDDSAAVHGLGFKRESSLEAGLRTTIQWYLDHPDWMGIVTRGLQ